MSRVRLTVAVLLICVGLALPVVARANEPVPGGQGTDTSLPLTDSAVTVTGRGPFAELEITVNQTEVLTNQAISITWEGGTPTRTSPGTFSDNYLQIMQCWGEDDGSVPENPGPPPEQCVFGAIGSVASPPSFVYPDAYAVSRITGLLGQTIGQPEGIGDGNGLFYRPFRAVDGIEVDVQVDPDFIPGVSGGNSWLNPYFNAITTNEIAGAKTDESGRGSELFEVHTGLQSAGLGCGQRVQEVAGGDPVIPKCWLVIVPRGDSLDENVGTTLLNGGAAQPVGTSPLRSASWANRIAIPLEFVPVDTSCPIGADERRLAGNDQMQTAIASWQPVLCSTDGLPPYSFVPVGDAAARQQLASGSTGGAGMVVVSAPLGADQVDPASPAVYAPIGLSGIVIGFNVERNPRSGNLEEARLLGTRVARINLTPRLVAKLLTQSYGGQVKIAASVPPEYDWLSGNPESMAADPDFLQFNDEFHLLMSSDDRTFSGLQLPSGTSDAARQLWNWILADPEAAAWMAGAADEWGMRVNPVYSTDPATNPSGIGFDETDPTGFPKADPYCFEAPPRGVGGTIVPPPLCGTDWMPYSRNYVETARAARLGFDGARIAENPFAQSSAEVWSRSLPQYISRRMMLSLTDTVSAAQFGLQVAHLSRAGDGGIDRTFVAPDDAGLTAAVAAMVPSESDDDVLVPDPTVDAPGGYPLAVLSYAAAKPLSLDMDAREDYARFLEYAVDAGQVRGLEQGQLPNGYTPLTDELRTQSARAVDLLRSMIPTPTSSTTTTTAPPPPAGGGGGGYGGGSSSGSGGPGPEVIESTTTSTASLASTTTSTSSSSAPSPTTPSAGGAGAGRAMTGFGLAFVGSALGALEITKRPRRARPDTSDPSASEVDE